MTITAVRRVNGFVAMLGNGWHGVAVNTARGEVYAWVTGHYQAINGALP